MTMTSKKMKTTNFLDLVSMTTGKKIDLIMMKIMKKSLVMTLLLILFKICLLKISMEVTKTNKNQNVVVEEVTMITREEDPEKVVTTITGKKKNSKNSEVMKTSLEMMKISLLVMTQTSLLMSKTNFTEKNKKKKKNSLSKTQVSFTEVKI